MKYVINANPVDVQDRNGFRRYLGERSKKGLQAIHIFPAFTVFKKVENAPPNYEILFAGNESDAHKNNIYRPNNGIVIQACVTAAEESSWWEDISGAYDRIFLYRRIAARSQFIGGLTRLVVPLLALVTMPYWLGSSGFLSDFAASSGVTATMITAVFVLFAYAVLKYMLDSLVGKIDRQHLDGIRQALVAGQIYCTPVEMEKEVQRKNWLLTWCYPAVVLAMLIYALVLFCTIG